MQLYFFLQRVFRETERRETQQTLVSPSNALPVIFFGKYSNAERMNIP
jgi:hypothetical protein